MFNRSRNIISFEGAITASQICMIPAGMAGIGIHTVSTSARTRRILEVY
jgi:hypothetical protein